MPATGSSDFKGTARFRILRRIGAGGMGVVYEADDLERGQRVALKTLKTSDSNTLYRLKREFRALADLHHPNLVELQELVVAEECFFTMELLDGVDLLAYLRSAPPEGAGHPSSFSDTVDAPVAIRNSDDTLRLPPRDLDCNEARLRVVLPQLVHGLTALHAAGKVHRDVKPSNTLVTRDGRVVLLDFGLVTQADPLAPESFDGHIVGTVSYMAPEQCRGEARLTPAADFYALGVVLYEALTGRLPFDGPVMQVLLEKQQHAPPPPRALRPGVPDDLDDLCADLLKRTAEERPDGAQILRRLGVEGKPAKPSSHTTRASPFAGREPELARLDAGLAAMARGQAAVVLVCGPSGIGKSTLCQQFLGQARARFTDLVLLQGRCYERENVPYQAMDSLIDNLSQYWLGLPPREAGTLLPRGAALLSRLFPVLGRVPCVDEAPRTREVADPQEQRTRAFAALREVVQRIGERHPLVLVLDDMQWADAATLALLSDLLRPPDPPRLLLVLSTRNEGQDKLVELLKRTALDPARIELAPLSDVEAHGLVVELLGPEAAPVAADVAREAAGNPFFIGELCKYVESGEGAPLGGVSLDQVLRGRMEKLAPAARKLLEVLAVAAEPISQRAAGSAAEISPPQVAREAGILRTLRLVRSSGERAEARLEPYHDRIRTAVEHLLTDEARRAHHLALAQALKQWSEASEEQLARHWLGAGNKQRAAEHARRAADNAIERLDFDRAAELYRMTLDAGEFASEERRAILKALGGALFNAGRPKEAAETFLLASEGSDAAAWLELRNRSAEALLRGGYVQQGLTEIVAVLGAVGLRLAKTPLRALLSLLLRRGWLRLRGLRVRRREATQIPPRQLLMADICWSVAAGFGLVDTIRGADYQTRGLLLALRTGDARRVARALSTEAGFLSAQGTNRQRIVRVIERAEDLNRSANDPYINALVTMSRSGIAYFIDNAWRASLELSRESEAGFRQLSSGGWEIDTMRLMSTWGLHKLGELAELTRLVPSWVREAERRGDLYAAISLRTRANLVWLVADDVARAQDDLEHAIASWMPPERSYQVQHLYGLYGRVDLALYRGDAARAAAQVAAADPLLQRSLLLRLPILRVEVLHNHGRIALALGALPGADARGKACEARACAKRLRRERMPVADAMAALLVAGAAHLDGDRGVERRALEEAVATLDATETRMFAAAARHRLGTLLGGDEGRALLAAAAAWYRNEGVKSPARLTAMNAPGWD